MRLGWAEILVILILVLILFGHAKIPGMMKNLADGINVFKNEMKKSKTDTKNKTISKTKKNIKNK